MRGIPGMRSNQGNSANHLGSRRCVIGSDALVIDHHSVMQFAYAQANLGKCAMGMFDHIRCEIPLPDGFTGEMQTKDFDCALSNLLIRANGRLMIEEREWEAVSLEERQNSKLSFLKSRRVIARRWRDLDFHGDFHFYGWQKSDDTRREYWARFTHGSLEFIKLVSEGAAR